MAFTSINPSTGEKMQSYPEMQDHETFEKIKTTHEVFKKWKKISFDKRSACLKSIANNLRERKQPLAELMAKEMGKPMKQGVSEIDKCAWVCEFYADNAESFLDNEIIKTDASLSYVHYEPLGVIFSIMPWNFPFWQVFRGAAPALMAGNGMVLKHASNVTGCALAIQEIFNSSSLPDGLFETLLITIDNVPKVIEDPNIAAVTLTGSTPAGKAVASKAGSVLKKCVLELGGSDPYIILEDADLQNAAKLCATSRMINNGQSCVSAKRFIAVKKIHKRFESLLMEEMNNYKYGHPLDEATIAGPMARIDLRDDIHRQVTETLNQGAKLLMGGKMPKGEGAFYPATVISQVEKGMCAYEEEIFGPVAAIIEAEDENAAIRIANDSSFGLGAAVFTQDKERGERIAAHELDAGCCFVNSFVKSDPRLPFGGIKESGFGRELGAIGIREFVNIKTVYVQ